MATRASRGTEALESELGHGAAGRVERVDADADGVLVYTVGARSDGSDDPLESGASARWFRFDGDLRELHARDDSELPWCRANRPGAGSDLEILSWRPGRRITLRRGTDGVVVKAYRKRRARRSADRLERARVLTSASEVFRVPRVLGIDESTSSLVMETLAGSPPRIRPEDAELFSRLGALVARWQDAVDAAGLEEHGAAAELAVLDERARRFELVHQVLPPGWRELRERCTAPAAALASRPLRAAHRDLHDGQLLVGDGSPGLLDFDLLCAADPVLDLANLAAHLRLRALQGLAEASDEGAAACAHALVEGFAGGGPPPDPDAFAFYRTTTFLRLALVYGLRPRWAHLVGPLVELGRVPS